MEGMKVAAWAINKSGGVNGRKIKLNIYQTGGTPEGAASAYRKAGSNKNNIGAFLGAAGGLAVRALSNTVKMPFISASGNDAIDRPVTKYVFSNSAGKEYATASVVYAFKNLGARSFAIMHYDTDFSSQIESAIRGRCAQLGCKVTDVEAASAVASVDQLIPQLTKMKASNPDAYYIESLNPNAMAGARQLGMFDKPVIAEQWLTVPALAQACGKNCEGVVFGAHKCVLRSVLPSSDPVVKLCKQYVAQWNAYHKGKLPYSQFSIYGRDAVYTYAFAAKKVLAAKKPLTRANIVAAMEHLKGDIATTHGRLFTSPNNHRLTGTWHEAYVDTTIKMVNGQPTWVLAPKADPKGSTP
jgi:branched-chain amino acid transport system substrate-binding protein